MTNMFEGIQIEESSGNMFEGIERQEVSKDNMFTGLERVTDDSKVKSKVKAEDKGIVDSVKDIAHGTYETAQSLGVGLAGFIPGTFAQYGAIGGAKIQTALEDMGVPMTWVKKAQKAIGFEAPTSPREQELMGEEIANYIMTAGGLTEPKTKSGQASLGLVGKGFEAISTGAHKVVEPWINKEVFPNAHNLLTLGVELPVYAVIPIKIKQGYKALNVKLDKIAAAKGKRKAVNLCGLLQILYHEKFKKGYLR